MAIAARSLVCSSTLVRPALERASATRTVRARAAVAPKGIRTPLRVSAGIRMPPAVAKAQEKMSVEGLAAFGALSALTAANPALAVSEVAQVADDRIFLYVLLFGPVLGWVGFNILPGFLNQLDDMSAKNRSIGGAVGLSAAALLAAPHAQAAQEVAQVADDRLVIFFLLFGPVLGWVGFNILPGFLNQIDDMSSKNRSIGGAVGLSAAALLAAPHAQAAQEVAQVADDRLVIFFLLFGPVLGWVGFNILPGFLNQIDDMSAKNK